MAGNKNMSIGNINIGGLSIKDTKNNKNVPIVSSIELKIDCELIRDYNMNSIGN